MSHVAGKTDEMLVLSPPVTGRATLADYIQMTKPRITLMVVITAFIGFNLATRHGAAISSDLLLTLTFALVGTALACMGSAVLNQVIERDTDALMRRTRNRPLPAGRISARTASWLGLSLACAGVGLLLVTTNSLAAGLAAFTITSYVLLYTPMKRLSHASTIVGALPGALPPVIGYAAATGRLGVEAVLLFSILFLWQLPHFLAIAWLYREEYAAAGLPMLPVIEPDGASTFRQILLGCLTLLPLGLMPTMAGVCGMLYFFGALAAGLVFLAFGVWLVVRKTRAHARMLFFASLIYLPAVFILMLIDQT
jgi:heme o synthase